MVIRCQGGDEDKFKECGAAVETLTDERSGAAELHMGHTTIDKVCHISMGTNKAVGYERGTLADGLKHWSVELG